MSETEATGPIIANRGIHHAAVVVSDLDRSIAFYTDLFGGDVALRIDDIEDPRIARLQGVARLRMSIAMIAFGPVRFELIQFDDPVGRGEAPRSIDLGCAHLAFEVADVEAAYARLRSEDVDFEAPPVHLEEGPAAGWVIFYGRDPDGNRFEVLQTVGA